MKRPIMIGIAVVVLLAGIFLFTNKSDSPNNSMDNMQSAASDMPKRDSSKQPLGSNEAEMSNFSFGPNKLTVKKGTTVTWTNRDTARHNVAFDTGSLKGKEGELIGQGETYKFTFQETGTFDYHCSPHPYMKASVEVIE